MVVVEAEGLRKLAAIPVLEMCLFLPVVETEVEFLQSTPSATVEEDFAGISLRDVVVQMTLSFAERRERNAQFGRRGWEEMVLVEAAELAGDTWAWGLLRSPVEKTRMEQ